MPNYLVTAVVIRATGTQVFTVDADSPEDARQIVADGGGKFEHEELEVQKFSPSASWHVELNE